MRSQFTFYESFYKAIRRIKDPEARAAAYDMICDYALCQKEPDLDSVPDSVAIAFELLRPVLDKARSKSESNASSGKQTSPKTVCTKSVAVCGEPVPVCTKSVQNETAPEGEGEIEIEVEKEIEVEIEKDTLPPSSPTETSEVCAELPSSATPPEPPVITLPLIDGTEFPVAQEKVSEFSGLYPAVDVMQELRNMRGWLLANPKNRKTKNGVMRFITAWLSREQNQARPSGGSRGYSRPVEEHGLTKLRRLYEEEFGSE